MMESSTSGGFTVAMPRGDTTPGVDIIDPIERRRCSLRTAEPVTLESGDPESFRFPVGTVVDIETSELSAPFTGQAYVRDEAGDVVAHAPKGFEGSFTDGHYQLELTGLIKVYLGVEAAFSITNSNHALEITFREPTRVSIGSRSLHEQPASTVTTTSNPIDLMAAVSTFGSALKTTSPERCFPSSRGHPPALELGEELSIPDGLEPPVSDLQIEVPPRLSSIVPVTSLTYFLGARLSSGARPRIVGPTWSHPLDGPAGFERTVQRTLQQLFLLECVTRTEGFYPVNLYERSTLEDRIDLDYASLYEAPLPARIERYLDVPYELVEDLIPDWRLAAHVDPTFESAMLLPYLANDLAILSIAEPEVVPESALAVSTSGFTRGASTSEVTDRSFVRPRNGADAIDTAWLSEGTPVEATKAVPAAYHNRLGRTPQEEDIAIAVICNSDAMEAEREIVDDVYGNHESMPFDVTVRADLSTAELGSVLQQDYDFVHYIGHIDDDGFRCSDGRLDARAIDELAPAAFFLNACQSYDQGLGLIEGGAIGGIVTLDDVVNHGAVRIGQAVARLLNCGFPLRTALDLAATQSVIGSQYVVVGDGTLSIVQPPGGTSQVYRVTETSSGVELVVDGFGSPAGMGCLYMPYVPGNEQQYLAGGTTPAFQLTEAEYQEFLALEEAPVLIDETMQWSSEILLGRL